MRRRQLVDETIAERPGRVHRDLLEMFERIVLQRASGDRRPATAAARLLGLNRNTVRGRCFDLQIHVPRGGTCDCRATRFRASSSPTGFSCRPGATGRSGGGVVQEGHRPGCRQVVVIVAVDGQVFGPVKKGSRPLP